MLARIRPSPLTSTRAREGTYSIVARDCSSGELGVAVQSHWFSVGPIVPWARAGVGAVATQANVEVAYGPRGLELLAQGLDAPTALAQLLTEDGGRDTRQVAIIDSSGTVAVHTGDSCMAFAGHSIGDGVSCQANVMASERVWPAMLNAFETSSGRSLTTRLLATLTAAEAEGGDIRGRQSAAILVVPDAGASWDSVISLRVEDHPDPLGELARLVRLHDAYAIAGQADECVAAGRHDQAARLYLRASQLVPESHELRFWAGLGAAQVGDMDSALAHVNAAIDLQPGWRQLLPRLTPGVAPAARAVLEALQAAGK